MEKLFRDILIYWVLLVALISLTMFLPNARSEEKDFDFTLKGIYSVYQDRDLLEDGRGLKGELSWKGIYLWGSWEQTELRLTGQRGGAIRLYGFGPGLKIKLVDGLFVFGEVGYYIPDADIDKNAQKYEEGNHLYWVRTLKEVNLDSYASQFTKYQHEFKGGVGGSIGLEFKQELYKNLSVMFTGAYRFLSLKEDWDAYSPTIPNSYIQTKEKRSFSGGQFGIGLSYRF